MPDITLSMELAQGIWTDVTKDALKRHPVRWSRGIFGSGPNDLVARPGSLTFALNNAASNSAGLQGYYSPAHSNVRGGFGYGTRVKLLIEQGAASWYHFSGRISKIAPTPGTTGSQETFIVVEDYMALLAEFDDLQLTLQENVRPDELLDGVVALLSRAPANKDFDVAIDTYPFAFDDLGGRKPPAMSVAQAVCQSERGRLYNRGDATDGETLRFENRHARALEAVADTFLESECRADPPGMEVPSDLGRVFNDVEVAVFPRRVDSAASTVLVNLEAPVEVAAGATVTLFADFRDPSNDAEYVGGKDMVQPQPTTDYTGNTAEDGSGSDVTADISVVATYFAYAVKLEITNNGASTAYVRGPGGADGLRARGKGMYRYSALVSQGENSGSISDIGRRRLPTRLDMPYQNDRNVGQGVADFLANLYGGVGNVPTRLRLRTEIPSILERALVRDIGDRIKVSEALCAVDEFEVHINAIEGEISPKGVVGISWVLAPADTSDLLILDDPVAGVLDSNALGYA